MPRKKVGKTDKMKQKKVGKTDKIEVRYLITCILHEEY